MNNTCGHYQDNVAQYFLAHITDLFNAGLVAVMFGAGNRCQTTNTDTPADGVTNNNGKPTSDQLGGCNACNAHASSYSDNDGGFLRVFVGQYYWTAGYAFIGPASWVQGQTQSVSITLNNTGNQTWVHTGANPVMLDMHFTTQTGGSSKINFWSTSQIFALPNDVAPSGSLTFSVSVTAPASAAGSMSLEAELFKNQQFWFPQAQAQPVTVNYHWQGSVDLSAAPTSWAGGQTQSFSITITNQGDQTWVNTGTNPVMLDINFSTQNGGNAVISCCWKTSQLISLPSSVAPGASVTFTVNVTAPSGAGSYFLEAQLFKNQQFWFPTWNSVAVTVS